MTSETFTNFDLFQDRVAQLEALHGPASDCVMGKGFTRVVWRKRVRVVYKFTAEQRSN